MTEPDDFGRGSRFRSIEDVEVLVLTQWLTRHTGGHRAILPKGQEVRVVSEFKAQATAATLLPLRYDELHADLVPHEDREADKYNGYYLVISFEVLGRAFSRVE